MRQSVPRCTKAHFFCHNNRCIFATGKHPNKANSSKNFSFFLYWPQGCARYTSLEKDKNSIYEFLEQHSTLD